MIQIPWLQISDLEVSDCQLRKLLGNFEKEKEDLAQGESEMKNRINQLLGMLREAEETAVREAAYHEREVNEIHSDLDLAHRRLEELESVNVSVNSWFEAFCMRNA
jgi:chromosome segregation ATPase